MDLSRASVAVTFAWLALWIDANISLTVPATALWLGFAVITAFAFFLASRCSTSASRKIGLSLCFIPLAHLLHFSAAQMRWNAAAGIIQALSIAAIFVIGLAWLVKFLESRATHSRRVSREGLATATTTGSGGFNPFDLSARFYRPTHRRLDQSLLALVSYVFIFLVLFILLTRLPGCDIYELPLGGGKPKPVQKLRLQKVVEKKFVINPFSVVRFNPPPIEKVQLKLLEATHHAYEVGYGEDDGAGFAGGTARGKVEFVRVQYDGGDWDQDLNKESDLNMLTEYQVRTGHKCAEAPKIRRIGQLAGMRAKQSPAFVYITGQGSLITSKREQEILRELITDRHGMIFADNGGSGGWHQQFFDNMRKILPNIEPVRVPLDHPIHRLRYDIPFLPYVAPHGGKDAWGWVVEGRLAAYYHPGDIGDAWGNGHAGVRREIWEYCYQLGVNAMLYAHSEKSKWLVSVEKQKGKK